MKTKITSSHGYWVLFCCALLSASCCGIKIDKPKKVEDPIDNATPAPSYINVSACVTKTDFLRAVKENIQNPIVKDDNPVKAVAAILATQDITVEEFIKVITRPYQPGYWKDVAVKTYQTIKVAFGCWLNPFKWGKCWKDVVKEVWTTTQVWVEPVAEFWVWQSVAVTKVINLLFEPEVTIHYPTYLDDIDITFTGNKYKIIGYTTTDVKLDVQSKVIPLTPDIKIKSLLNLDVRCEVIIEGEINITDGKQIVMTGATGLNIKTPMDKLPKIGGKDFHQYLFLDLALQKTIEKLVEDLGKKALQKALDKLIEKNQQNLNFAKQIDHVTQAMSGSKQLGDSIWLNLKPLEISCSNLYGNNEQLCIDLGLQFEPTVNYAMPIPDLPPGDVPFRVRQPQEPDVNLNLKLTGGLQTFESMIAAALNNALSSHEQKILRSLRIENVDIYRTENNKAVIVLDVIRKRKLYKCQVFSAVLVADLVYDNGAKQFALKNVDFSIATKSKLINTAYDKLLDAKIEDYIEANAIYDIAEMYKEASAKIENLSYQADYGLLSGTLAINGLSGPYLTDSTIDVITHLKGRYTFKFTPKKPESITPNDSISKAHGIQLEAHRTESRQGKPNPEAPMALPVYGKNELKKPSQDGEIIYVAGPDGKITQRRKTFEDQLFEGEEVIIIDSQGNVSQKVVE